MSGFEVVRMVKVVPSRALLAGGHDTRLARPKGCLQRVVKSRGQVRCYGRELLLRFVRHDAPEGCDVVDWRDGEKTDSKS